MYYEDCNVAILTKVRGTADSYAYHLDRLDNVDEYDVLTIAGDFKFKLLKDKPAKRLDIKDEIAYLNTLEDATREDIKAYFE